MFEIYFFPFFFFNGEKLHFPPTLTDTYNLFLILATIIVSSIVLSASWYDSPRKGLFINFPQKKRMFAKVVGKFQRIVFLSHSRRDVRVRTQKQFWFRISKENSRLTNQFLLIETQSPMNELILFTILNHSTTLQSQIAHNTKNINGCAFSRSTIGAYLTEPIENSR